MKKIERIAVLEEKVRNLEDLTADLSEAVTKLALAIQQGQAEVPPAFLK